MNARLAAVSALLALQACGGRTQITSTWADPEAEPLAFIGMAAVFISSDSAERRIAEAHLAQSFMGAMPSYAQMPVIDSAGPSAGGILPKLRDFGFDVAVVMQVTEVFVVDSAGPAPVRVVSVETRIFDLQSNRLVFAAHSGTPEPESCASLVDAVAKQIVARLHKKGLVR